MAQIICKNLSLGYDDNPIATGLNFTINKGDYLSVVGENGSGKSTLIKTLLSLVPPISGELIKDDGFIPTKTGYMPQQTSVQKDFPASVMEVVISGCTQIKGLFSYNKRKECAKFNLERVGLSDVAGKSFRDLSGGQQQRVFLARALCAAENILLLDEPAAGLDPLISSELYTILSQLNRDEKITVIMVSHDISSAIRYASHILHIGESKSFFGTSSEYLASDFGKIFTGGGVSNE